MTTAGKNQIMITTAIPADIWTEEDNEGMSSGLGLTDPKDAVGLPPSWPAAGVLHSDPPLIVYVTDRITCCKSIGF